MKFGQQQHSPSHVPCRLDTTRRTHGHGLSNRRSPKRHWLMRGALLAATMPIGLAPGVLQPVLKAAHADVYHAVEPGETLRSIASHYGLSASSLQAINHLEGTKENAPLSAMLLRVPGTHKVETSSGIAEVAVDSNLSALPRSMATGTIAQSVRYPVQAGDTAESIAQRYARSGYKVSADDIRTKNHLRGEPRPGSTLLIPLHSTTYRASAQQSSTRPAPNEGTGTRIAARSVSTSDDNALPTVQVVPSEEQPVYRSITEGAAAASRARGGRRPTMLASRGYIPTGSREGVRVLPQDQDAPNTGAAPRPNPRVIQAPTQAVPAALAQVAQIASAGAHIRRLPDAGAATLYQCAVGTELAVTRQSGPWSAVLMSDRSTGWIPSRYLKFTGAQVDITSQVVTGSAAWSNSRPNYQTGGGYNGHYTGNCPMVLEALKWLGTPYSYGGEGRNGIDCSSLVQHSFAACGYRLPRTAAEQARVGQPVDPAHLQPGDRLYFSASGTRIDHTGLYMGNGQFVQASGHGRMVIVSNLFEARSWNIFVCARR